VSPELVAVANLERSDGKKSNAAIRGVGPQARALRGNLRETAGRWFRTGLGEIVVGVGAGRRFRNLGVGDRIFFAGRTWSVVGHFEAEGQSFESEVWGDIDDLKAQFKREYSALLVRCPDAAELARLGNLIRGSKQLSLDAKSHIDYYRGNNQAADMLKVMGSMMGVVLAIGAVFGAANTMYTAVASRTREVATMRVLGFGRLAIALSFVLEAAFLGLAGGLIGVGGAYAGFHGMAGGTVNWNTFSDMAFKFRVDPPLMGAGLALAVVTGVVGGLLPALRAGRVPIAAALRGL
jgi:putative ABC transport system permease protein